MTTQAQTDAERERWMPIPEYIGFYEASSIGRIKSLARGGRKERMLRLHKTTEGYMRVGLTKNGICKGHGVHRLVALAFLGETKLKTNHINSIKTDNRIENLEYVSNRENVNHSKMNKRDLPTGVTFRAGKYVTIAFIDGKNKYFGRHATPEAAHEAYLMAVRGEYKYAL